jgi:hypothetical protein
MIVTAITGGMITMAVAVAMAGVIIGTTAGKPVINSSLFPPS